MKKNNIFQLVLFSFASSNLLGQYTLLNSFDSRGEKHGFWMDSIWSMDKKEKKLYCRCNYLNGKREGKCVYFYYDKVGGIRTEGYYKNDTLHGESKVYRPDGTLYQIEEFNMGKTHGIKKFFDENGVLTDEEDYENGIKTGSYRSFYPTGKIRRKINTYHVDPVSITFDEFYSDDEKNELMQMVEYRNEVVVRITTYRDGKILKVYKNE